MKILPLFLLLSIVYPNLWSQFIVVEAEDKAFFLEDKSFSISSHFHNDNKLKIHLTESYSYSQNRARLQKKDRDLSEGKNFIFDAQIGNGMTFNTHHLIGQNLCSAVDLSTGHRYMFDNYKKILELIIFVREKLGTNNIIGPAQILFLIGSQAKSMKMIPGKQETKNHEAIVFELDYWYYEQIKLRIYYAAEEVISNAIDFIRSTIPYEVDIMFLNSGELRIIKFTEFKMIDDSRTNKVYTKLSDPNLDETTSGQQYKLDHFTYPIGLNCSNGFEHRNLFEDYDINTLKFSFSAYSEQNYILHYRDFKHFVAFDGRLQTMRIDTLRTSDRDGRKRDTLSLLDYKTNRKYTILESRLHKSSSSNLDLGDSDFYQGSNGENRCFVTTIMSPGNRTLTDTDDCLHLSEYLLGPHELVYMGRAQVRGINARVYEGHSTRLPQWFSEPLVFKWLKGGKYDYLDKDLSTNQDFVIVAFFTDKHELLQLNVYNERYEHHIERYLIVQVRNFIWDLLDSPDGDRGFEMFSQRQELCSVGSGKDKYIELNLLLESETDIGMTMKNNDNELDDSLNWLNDWSTRNEALAAGLKDLLGIQSMMMYDLESHIMKISSKPVINVRLRVAENPEKLYQITYIGEGFVSRFDKKKAIISKAKSFIECLWMVGESKSVYVYYLHDDDDDDEKEQMNCFLDPYLIRNPDKTIDDSKFIKQLAKGPGKIFKIDSKLDTKISLANTWLRDEQLFRLENKVFVMENLRSITKRGEGGPITFPSLQSQSQALKMRIKRIKLNNVNYMNNISPSENAPIKRAIIGFGLDELGDNNWRIDSIDGHPVETNADSDGSGGSLISLEQCHAACLSDFNCKSYSYCLNYPQAQCLLSSIDLKAGEIQSKFSATKDSSSSWLKLAKGSRINIDLKVGEGKQKSLDLIRDFKCELYGKHYIELFERLHTSTHALMDVKAYKVSSEEDCAELCFASSNDFFKTITSSDHMKQEEEEDFSKLKSKLEAKAILRTNMYGNYKLCSGFSYLESTLNEKQKKALGIYLSRETSNINTTGDGYCFIPTVRHEHPKELDYTSFEQDHYHFKYISIYEKRSGFRLAASPMSPKLEDAYKKVLKGKPTESEQHKLLMDAINNGHNFQYVVAANSDICATMCYTGNYVWPSCKSFDYESFEISTQVSSEKFQIRCYLNSNSMSQIKPENMISGNNGSLAILQWHFEPRFDFVGRQAQVLSKLNQVIEGLSDNNDETKERREGKINSSNEFITFLLVLVAIGSGLILGVGLAKKFRNLNFLSKQTNFVSSSSSMRQDLNPMIPPPSCAELDEL